MKTIFIVFIMLFAQHVFSQTKTTASVSAAGWKRVAYSDNQTGRGFGKISIHTSGGASQPQYLDIEWFKDWSTTGGMSIKTNGRFSTFWTTTRLTWDEGSTTSYLEVYFSAPVPNLSLISDNYGWNVAKLYSGELPNGGGTVRTNVTVGKFNVGNQFYVDLNGNVGIGTVEPDTKLAVNGNIRAKEIKVETANWPDYVFNEDYKLTSLPEVEQYIKKNGHLPDMPKAEQVEADGILLGEMNKLLVKKIEELTLHLIEKDKVIKEMLLRLERLEHVK